MSNPLPDPLLSSALLCLALLAGAAPLGKARANENQAAAPATVPGSATPKLTAVTAARLDSVWLKPQREAAASVVPRNESRLAAEATGTLLNWTADVGASVTRGQLLAQIDPRDAELAVQRAQAGLEAAEARLALAQGQLKRSRELVDQAFLSQEALAQRETEVTLTQAEVNAQRSQRDTAQRQLSKTRLYAPFAGVVKERLAQTGESVAPGTVLYVLTEAGASEVQAAVPPSEVAGLRDAAQRSFVDGAGLALPVKLLRINPTLNPASRTQTVRLGFMGQALPAGTQGSLQWQESRPHLAPGIMVRRGAQLGVFVVQTQAAQSTARFVPLPGAQEGRATVVPAGLAADTPIVVQGQAALQHGMAIQVQAQR